jgi:hypothetical protein
VSSNAKMLEVITVDASPHSAGGYVGQFTLPLTYDANITNELTNRMKNAGSNRELKYDEITFIDRANNKCKARDLMLTGQTMHNHFVYESDGTKVIGAHVFRFTCNDFTMVT